MEYGLSLPRRLQIEFSRAVQAAADQTGREITADEIHAIFSREYLERRMPYAYIGHRMASDSARDEPMQIEIDIERDGIRETLCGAGHGPIEACVQALGLEIRLMDYHEHAIGSGADAKAACYIELRLDGGPTRFGVGIDGDIVAASFKALLSAVNRQIDTEAATVGGGLLRTALPGG